MTRPVCSIVVVNYDGLRFLDDCLRALENLEYPRDLLDIIMVDNGSRDGSVPFVNERFPGIRTFVSETNSFARALNLGVRAAKGELIAFVNNDVTVAPTWLPELVASLADDARVGAVGGKLLLQDGRINSAGIRELPDFFWDDIGFEEEDRGQYDSPGERWGLCWAAVLFRRACLENVGPVDEDFVMYCEDVDFAKRCQLRGWTHVYRPRAVAHHAYAGSSAGRVLPEYFCNRNRFLYVAKHQPASLPHAVETSHFFAKGQHGRLLDAMLMAIKKLFDHQDATTLTTVLPRVCDTLVALYGARVVDRLLARLEVVLGYRKMSMAIYDHALHVIGGGQRYVATMAATLRDRFDITYIANEPVRIADLEAHYQLDLSGCRLKTLPLAFYEERGRHWIDSGMVTEDVPNPFDAVAVESANYDVFVNANMLEKVRPLSPLSVFVCHFPDSLRGPYFAVDGYTAIVANSRYTCTWLGKRWGLEPSALVYPPVDMEAPRVPKQPLILSVARFEPGGSKKQRELVEAFQQLLRTHPEAMRGWRLVLVGGSLPANAYLTEVLDLVRSSSAPIEVKVDAPTSEIKALYAAAEIFWHACGLDETRPNLVEHFGMTTVEAMQNYAAPVVINGGGQREIVEHGRSGFLFDNVAMLCDYTLTLIADVNRRREVQAEAYRRSQCFTRARFEQGITDFFDVIEHEYSTLRLPDPQDILKRHSTQGSVGTVAAQANGRGSRPD
jgi:GT2 family glycosyltransferase